MNAEQMAVLNAVHQVNKHVLIALIAELKADPSRISAVLTAAAANSQLEPTARAMLEDMATGLGVIGGARVRKN